MKILIAEDELLMAKTLEKKLLLDGHEVLIANDGRTALTLYETENPAAWKLLINLIKVLNKTPEQIETVLDVDQTLWMLALNNTLVN
ncbi:MAG TPA: hypothetical protein PLU36_10785, partial [Chitinophagaceae bacterium]|nr:hypothetical protein [Chitinophagaceae bacterium]